MKVHLIQKLWIHDAVVTRDSGHVATCVSRLRVECWWLSHKRVLSSSPRHVTGPATFSRGHIIGGPRQNDSAKYCQFYTMHDLCCLYVYYVSNAGHIFNFIHSLISHAALSNPDWSPPWRHCRDTGPLVETWRQYHATWRPSECRGQTHAEYLQKQGQCCIELSTDLREVSYFLENPDTSKVSLH